LLNLFSTISISEAAAQYMCMLTHVILCVCVRVHAVEAQVELCTQVELLCKLILDYTVYFTKKSVAAGYKEQLKKKKKNSCPKVNLFVLLISCSVIFL